MFHVTRYMHTPVLLKEVIEVLNPQPGEFFIDGTVGSGGHAAAILEKIGPSGKLLGIDWDKDSVEKLMETKKLRNWDNLVLIHGNYSDLPEILEREQLGKANGLLLDLGFSSETLETGRGFSFLKNEPLDMRYDTSKGEPADVVINYYSEKELADIFWKYGEERFSRKIAKEIVESRKRKPIKTTFDLVEIIGGRKTKIHPATKVFQALRIYVNDELGNLEKLLKNLDPEADASHRYGAGKIIKPKGRVAIISFHSLEDRLVKNYFRDLKNQGKAQILTTKPIRPSREEIQANPRSRSAKLRAIIT